MIKYYRKDKPKSPNPLLKVGKSLRDIEMDKIEQDISIIRNKISELDRAIKALEQVKGFDIIDEETKVKISNEIENKIWQRIELRVKLKILTLGN